MIHEAECKKCGGTIAYDIKDRDINEVIAQMEEVQGFSCGAGNHVELGSPMDYITFTGKTRDEVCLTEEEFVVQLKEEYDEVRTSDEMPHNLITSFAFGFPITSDEFSWSFTHSPKGKRYYYHN